MVTQISTCHNKAMQQKTKLATEATICLNRPEIAITRKEENIALSDEADILHISDIEIIGLEFGLNNLKATAQAAGGLVMVWEIFCLSPSHFSITTVTENSNNLKPIS